MNEVGGGRAVVNVMNSTIGRLSTLPYRQRRTKQIQTQPEAVVERNVKFINSKGVD